MALIIPYSTALRFQRTPWLSMALVVLMTVIFIEQSQSRRMIEEAAYFFCATHEDGAAQLVTRHGPSDVDPATICTNVLGSLHEASDTDWAIEVLGNEWVEEGRLDSNEWQNYRPHLVAFYGEFQKRAPRSMDALLMTNPTFPNPLRMLSSTFAHADVGHLLGNMIFFIAFGPAIELIIANWMRFLGIVLLTGLASSLVEFLFDQLIGDPVPGLGFSGAVMGMIGLGAYLMPNAHVRTLVWFYFVGGRLHIPVWILAVWYVGWDIYDLTRISENPGIGFAAHVGGAFTGYLLGKRWLHDRKQEVQDEIAEETASQRSRRWQWVIGPEARFQDRARIEAEESERNRRLAYDRLIDRLYNFARTGRSGEAVALLASELDSLGDTVTTWMELLETIQEWRQGRFALCVARMTIERLCETGRYGEALRIFEQTLKWDEKFVLCDPARLPELTQTALDMGCHKLAFALVSDSADRYPRWRDTIEGQLLEARILIDYLAEPARAREIVHRLLSDPRYVSNRRLLSLASALGG